jgi:hypothetical protein
MYPWGKIKDETINFLKTNYLMLLITSVIASFAVSIASGVLGGVLGGVNSLCNLMFAFMINADSTILNILGTIFSFVVSFVFGVLSMGVSYFVTGIVTVGIAKTFENAKNTGAIDLNYLLYPFKSNFKNIAMVEFKKSLEITLLSLLCIVPGVIKFYQYFMVDFLLADNPNLPAKQVMEISKNTTSGDRLNIFLTNLLVGFIICLGIIACCMGQFFLMPIAYITQYEIYRYLRTKAITNGYVDESYLVTL